MQFISSPTRMEDDVPDLAAAEIMRLTRADAALLFPGDSGMIAQRYRTLARLWHPDRNPAPEAAAVFAHVANLHEAARQALTGFGKEARFRTRDGRSFRFTWQTRRAAEAGEILVGRRHIVHRLAPDLDDLARAAAARTLPFAGAAMRAQMEPVLPRPVAVLDTADGMVFVHAKTPDQVLLADLLRLGPVEPRHAAWMITRLMNIACWFEWAGLVHGAIGPDCLLISPQHHKVALTGPLICTTNLAEPPQILPERTLSGLPHLAVPGADVDRRVDPELVRLTIREALGDPAGTRLAADPAFPEPFATWLLMPGADGAQADFSAWERARDAAFGPRRFVQWDFDPAAVRAA